MSAEIFITTHAFNVIDVVFPACLLMFQGMEISIYLHS